MVQHFIDHIFRVHGISSTTIIFSRFIGCRYIFNSIDPVRNNGRSAPIKTCSIINIDLFTISSLSSDKNDTVTSLSTIYSCCTRIFQYWYWFNIRRSQSIKVQWFTNNTINDIKRSTTTADRNCRNCSTRFSSCLLNNYTGSTSLQRSRCTCIWQFVYLICFYTSYWTYRFSGWCRAITNNDHFIQLTVAFF